MKLEIQESAPNRKVYTITEKGKKAFLDSLRSPFYIERYKDALLMRMFFFAHLSKKERLNAAYAYLNQIKSVAKELQSVRPDVEANADRFQLLCFEFGLRFSDDLIGNVEKIILELQKDE
jgi:hypothetical protein